MRGFSRLFGFVAVVSAAVLTLTAVRQVSAQQPRQSGDGASLGEGEQIAIPGARAIDHAGFVVPDLDEAVTFFEDIFGAAILWRTAPVGGDVDMRAMFNAEPGATSRLAMLRLGPNLNLELIEWTVPGERRTAPPASDVGVGHLAFNVADMEAAGAYLRAKGVRMLEGPRINRSGPNAGQISWFFVTPWNMPVELVQRPAALPYERDTEARLFRLPL